MISGAPYLIDKLYNYKQAVFGEALTFFGVSNLGNIEKNERMITDEVNANNELTYHCADTFKQPLQEFIERTNEVLNHKFELIENAVNYNTVKKGVFGEDKNEDEGDEETQNLKNLSAEETDKLVSFMKSLSIAFLFSINILNL